MLFGDLDGVFADFPTAASAANGRPEYEVTTWNFFEDWGITEEQFWAPIKDLGDSFYGELVQPFPWFDELVDVLDRYDKDWVIATAPHDHPTAYSGKKIWCDRYLPGRALIVLKSKTPLAKPGVVLLDDNDGNVQKFRQHGGDGVLFPQPWNAARDSTLDRLGYCEQELGEYV